MPIVGHATPEGTSRYRARFLHGHPEHFRLLQDAWTSSIGLGTYLGDPDDATDQQYAQALAAAVGAGCNLIDTAINYRFQRSERVIGATLERLINDGAIARDEIILCTKGGYVPFDATPPDDASRYVIDTFFRPGILRYDELVAGCHAITPRYLEHQLSASLANLRVETIDGYYLHNPEQQLDEVPREAFHQRLEAAFAYLEQQAAAGRIRWYGTATWHGYRVHAEHRSALQLADLVGIAQRIGGSAHHFRLMQLPYNLAMPEAHTFKNQRVGDELLSPIHAAQRWGISVVASASLLQRRLLQLPPTIQAFLPGLVTDAQRAIQFVRSTPGVAAALVGMKTAAHVEANLALAGLPPLPPEQFGRIFDRDRRGAHAAPPSQTV